MTKRSGTVRESSSAQKYQATVYPQSDFQALEFPDLRDREVREKLSATAVKTFFKLIKIWGLRDEEGRDLLGGLSSSAYYDWKKAPQRLLEVDRLTRISYLIGIYKALHILYGDKLADEWLQLPNKNIIFAGQTPLEYMKHGGLVAMQTVRQLLDARRGGV